MNTFIRYAAILGLTLASAQAQAVEFSFISAGTYGNRHELTGLTITSSAWSNTAAGGQFEAAELNHRDFGMGVTTELKIPTPPTPTPTPSPAEINTTDALDNKGGVNDLILFSFSSAVSLKSLTMYQVGGDSDLSMWAGTGAFSPANKTADALGTASLFENTSARMRSKASTWLPSPEPMTGSRWPPASAISTTLPN